VLSLLSAAGDLPIPAQFGIAVPFAAALALIGRWFMQRLEAADKAKDELTRRLIDDVVPALTNSATVLKDVSELLREQQARDRWERDRRPSS
jgi:membrane protein implicated in regulation of membrane protease activity